MFPRVLLFLSTPSARRATRRCCSRRHCGQYFYPRPLRGGRRGGLAAFNLQAAISIHALCEEGDAVQFVHLEDLQLFLSTPSARRATIEDAAGDVPGGISIHALCEEGDQGWHHDHHGQQISIHALCEEGDSPILGIQYSHARFLSTPSARRATGCNKQVVDLTYISIHALCEEGDYCFSNAAFVRSKFLSTPSARRATDPRVLLQRARTISIHALCEEGDARAAGR